MYERKEKLKEEGLFITEFNDDFFENYLKEGKENEKIVQEIENLSKEYKRDGKKVKDTTWHFIIKAALRKINEYRPDIKLDLNKIELDFPLKYIASKFYSEPLFLEYDVAQEILYNLYRCAREDGQDYLIYDLEGMEEETEKDCEIVWEEYGDLFFSGRKMDKKEPDLDLLPGIKRLEAPKSKVSFSGCLDGSSLLLEADFSALNFLYLGNEKFQQYLRHKEKSNGYFDNLLKYIEILDKKCDIPLNYVWEKMTNFNVANIISKFVAQFISKRKLNINEGIEFIESISEGTDTLLNQITNMPNVLTRLIFLNKIFSTISMAYKYSTLHDISHHQLCLLRDALKNINDYYGFIQGAVIELSVATYWKMNQNQGKKLDIEKWIQEIENEYSLDSFKELLVSSSLEDQFARMEYNTHYVPVSISDVKQCIGKNIYSENINELAKKMQEEGWITEECRIQECENKNQHNEIVYYTAQMYNKDKLDDRFNRLKEKSDNKLIEAVLRPYLLSGYKNVIFENTDIQDEKGYIKIMNLLFYYFK